MGNAKKILIVEDERDIANLISFNLEQNGYDAEIVPSGEDAMKALKEFLPDLILLDIMLPGIDGLSVCSWIRKNPETKNLPVIILTAKGSEEEIVNGLELGADDYITKPFSPKVLLARIKNVLKHYDKNNSESGEKIKFNDIEICPSKREVKINDKSVNLTFSEFEILRFLIKNKGKVFTRNEIVNNLRGGNYPVTERSVDVLIVGLRKKLSDAAKYIETVRGVGYRFSEQ